MAKKKKLGSTARFGSRYSTPLKQVVNEIEKTQKTKQVCPQCGRKALKRKGYSKWECSKCKTLIAGGAYEPKTSVGDLVEKIIKRAKTKEEILDLEQQIEEAQEEEKGEEVEE